MDMSERAQALRERMLADEHIEWSDPGDLARMSLEKLQAPDDRIARSLHSRGEMRLYANVDANQAGLTSVAKLLGSFQSMVNSVGAAMEGFTGLVGRFPQHIASSMQLAMVTRPEFGSVVITIGPEHQAQDREIPEGELALEEEPRTTRIDSAVETTLSIIAAAGTLGPDSEHSDFVQQLRAHGPRVSAATRRILDVIARADFDLDLAWFEPHRATQRATLTRSVARQAASAFKSNDLESEDTHLSGQVVSAGHGKALEIRTAQDEKVRISTAGIASEQISGIAIDSFVRVGVRATIQSTTNGDPEVTYTAKSITPLADGDNRTRPI